IRILANEGLVHLRPARSPLVANPSLAEITDAIDVLRALELLSGELACERATLEEIAEIREIHERMSSLYDRIDTLDLFDIDMSFHTAIVHAAHNDALFETHKGFLERLWRARYLSASQRKSRERVLRQHGGIVEGLEQRDPEKVQFEIRGHLNALVDNIRSRFAEELAQEAEKGGNAAL
ncbi:MAG: GntR family transcriptional regulator, partial [Mangrovicoccus sp.]